DVRRGDGRGGPLPRRGARHSRHDLLDGGRVAGSRRVNGLPRDDAPALLHVCGRFLPLSETFTYDLIRGLDGFAHHVIADTRENADVFPWPSVHVSDDEAETWATLATHRID